MSYQFLAVGYRFPPGRSGLALVVGGEPVAPGLSPALERPTRSDRGGFRLLWFADRAGKSTITMTHSPERAIMCPATYTREPEAISTNRCRDCGDMVSAQFARVFGDNNDEVFGCTTCKTTTEILDWTR